MDTSLVVYNSLKGKKEPFKSIDPKHVGMYVVDLPYTVMFI